MLQRTRRNIVYYGKFDYRFHYRKTVYAFQICTYSVQKLNKLMLYYFYAYIFHFVLYFFLFNWLCWMVTLL